jgi:RAS protein activator-like 1
MAMQRFSQTFSQAGAAAGKSGNKAYWHTKIDVTVSEAKKLVGGGKDGIVDPYCYVSVDNEPVARTSTAWRENNPFFGEAFSLDVDNKSETVSVQVFSHSKDGNDEHLGKFEIARHTLEPAERGAPTVALDGWFPLTSQTKQTEVTGEVLVELLLSETDGGLDHLTVTIHKARDLLSKESTTTCNPICTVVLDAQTHTTDKVKGSKYPIFDKTFTFERAKIGPYLTVAVKDGSGGRFLGQAVVKLEKLDQDIPKQQWYRLHPLEADVKRFSDGSFGSIRLSVKLTNELVLPFNSYDGLVAKLIAEAATPSGIETGLVSVLGDILTDRHFTEREQCARTLVRVLLRKNACKQFLRSMNGKEIADARDSSTLFRGNSMGTKCTDQFMKITGIGYLHATLKEEIDRIFHEKHDCEIDPSKLPPWIVKKGDITKHAVILVDYFDRIVGRIFQSIKSCPMVMRLAFQDVQEAVRKNPTLMTTGDAPYTAVSGFLFLRFFAPAVLEPKLFGMREELADATTVRTLKLLAKALQMLGNLGSSLPKAGDQVHKEAYMEPLYPAIRKHLDQIRTWFDQLCTVDPTQAGAGELTEQAGIDSNALLLHGEVAAKMDPGGAFSSKAFKKRRFELTMTELHSGTGTDVWTVPVSSIMTCDVMEASAFDKKYVLVVRVTGHPSFYMNVGTSYERFLWLQAFRRAMKFSPDGTASLLSTYCPGTVHKGKWTCCGQRGDVIDRGCAKGHCSVVVDQFQDDPAPEIWAHNIFVLLMDGRPKIEAIAAMPGPATEFDRARVASTKSLLSVMDDINLAHLLHQDGGF